MQHAQRMGEYLRNRSALGLRLSELAILLIARCWTQQVEWAIHAPIAERGGISAATIEAIAEGRRPTAMKPDEAIVYDFCIELNVNRSVADATWASAIESFGEKGIVDLLGIAGYYTFLSMVMNAAHTEVPPSAASRLPALPS